MRPIMTESRHYMTHYIASCNRAIHVRNYDFSPVVPHEDFSCNKLVTLESTFYWKGNLIFAMLQIQWF